MEEKDREESLRRATEEVREGTRDASSETIALTLPPKILFL